MSLCGAIHHIGRVFLSFSQVVEVLQRFLASQTDVTTAKLSKNDNVDACASSRTNRGDSITKETSTYGSYRTNETSTELSRSAQIVLITISST